MTAIRTKDDIVRRDAEIDAGIECVLKDFIFTPLKSAGIGTGSELFERIERVLEEYKAKMLPDEEDEG